MTEDGWLGCDDPEAMLGLPQVAARHRKLRLFGCAASRRVWHLLAPRSRRAVEVAELYADRRVGRAELKAARAAAATVRRDPASGLRSWSASAAWSAARERGAVAGPAAACEARWAAREAAAERALTAPQSLLARLFGRIARRAGAAADAAFAAERAGQGALLRDIFGNPFRPIAPAVLTPTAITLAQAAYGERLLPSGHLDPARLAVLADALEEAGADEKIVSHLRGPGPHVRGCHAVDAVLGLS